MLYIYSSLLWKQGCLGTTPGQVLDYARDVGGCRPAERVGSWYVRLHIHIQHREYPNLHVHSVAAGVLPHPSEDRDVNVMPRVWAAVALVVLLLALCEAKKCVARLVNA